MYFLVVDREDNRPFAVVLLESWKGQLARNGLMTVIDEVTRRGPGRMVYVVKLPHHVSVLYLAFGTTQKSKYDDIEIELKLMFGGDFIGRRKEKLRSV